MEHAILVAEGPGEGAGGETGKVMTVQYNPGTLKLGEDASLSFELVFDAADNRDVHAVVRGFLGMLASPASRHVIFYWGNMSFPGEVSRMRASYDYFDADGTPLRAKIDLTLCQSGGYGSYLDYWNRAYDSFH